MAVEPERPDPSQNDLFRQFVNENMAEIDKLGLEPASNSEPALNTKEGIGRTPRWVKPDEDDIRYFGGFLYSWGAGVYKVEAILDTDDTLKSNKIKVRFLDRAKQLLDAKVKHYHPSGSYSIIDQIFMIDAVDLKDSQGYRTRPGIVFTKHPNIRAFDFEATLNAMLEKANKDLGYIDETQIPSYKNNPS